MIDEKRTCGDCAHLDRDGDYSGWCRPPAPVWMTGKIISHRHKDEPADECECFARKDTDGK